MPSPVSRTRTLRVAILAPISWRVPPRGYGPWEQFASLLTEGLVERGVDVTLFATADSVTTARLVGTAPTGYSEDPALHAKAWEALHISEVFEHASEFDVIHNSFDFLPLTYSGLVETPVVTTIHGFSSEQVVPVFEKYNRAGYYVAISDADRHERLDYVATIHHGIDLGEFELQRTPGDYLLFFGRVHPDKGVAEAIDVAERAGLPLTIAGIIQDRGYFEQLVEPRLDGERVSYVGPVGPDRRGSLLCGARALLHLVNFDEPFGFSVVEAMACGTPVIARRRGSMAEIVRHGENGFLVDTQEEAVAAVHALSSLDRAAVRASVEVEDDFARIAACGLDSVRVFLTWEDFQPAPDRVDRWMLERLVGVADLASGLGLALIPTLFTGHMSGVNWIPAWALGGSDGDRRFRVVSGGRVVHTGLRNWYTDLAVRDAQVLLAEEAAAALAGHEAVWAWDLGNENSNCVIPPTRSSARAWLDRLGSAIRGADDTALITVGLHMEDLAEDRRFGPPEASEACDLLSMHGYPIYARWADGPTDDQLLPFLSHMTHWLGEGRGVLFSEFGLPTYRSGDPDVQGAGGRGPIPLVEEEAAAAYTTAALEGLRRAGCLGALLWCYSDYAPSLSEYPPFDLAPHERTFGLWRIDGSPKPAVAAIAAFVGAERCSPGRADGWIDIDRDEFLLDPGVQLPRLYRRYRKQRRNEDATSA